MFADKKVGLALSGGGARGIAHLGVLKALDEADISISKITGTSAGAIIGAFYANGYPPDEILKIVKETRFVKFFRPAIRKVGLLDMQALGAFFKTHFPDDSFESLKIPLTVAATDIVHGRPAYFSSGELVNAVMASCCVPAIFSPIQLQNQLYVDGGILSNLPVEPLKKECDYVIASHCNPIDENFTFGNMKALIERSLLLAISNNTYQQKEFCNVFIEPPSLKKFIGSDIAKADEIFAIGYEYASEYIIKH